MRYTILGDSGLRVSEAALGTMTFGTEWGFGATVDECRRQFDLFAEAGGNFIDTADKYTDGAAERIVGDLVAADRDRFVLGTKYSLDTSTGDLNAGGNHRKNLRRSIEDSLRRLGTDHVDVLWLHAWDYLTPPYEVMRGLDDLVRSGKVSYLGISDTPAWIVAHLNTLARERGWTPFIALQVPYSLLQRDVERELLPMARGLGLGVTAWAPLAGGLLTGKYDDGAVAGPSRHREIRADQRVVTKAVAEVADGHGASSAAVALAWAAARGTIPILGGRTADQLASNLSYLDLELSDEDMRRLDGVGAIELGFPHDFLASQDWIHGGEIDRIVPPSHRVPFGR